MRCHDDEIAAPVRSRCNDGFIGLLVLHLNRVAGYTGLLRRIGRAIQHARAGNQLLHRAALNRQSASSVVL